MRFALLPVPLDDNALRLAAQMGVTDIVSGRPHGDSGPVWDYLALVRWRQKVESAGLRLSVIESIHVPDSIKLGLEDRDRDLEHFCESLSNMGAAGIPILCYNWMAGFGWMRTSFDKPGRGGAKVSQYDHAVMENAPLTEYGEVPDETLWENLEYFLKKVVPVAEKAGVKLALHPDDPPLSPIRGIARIMRTPDAFRRALEMVASDNNGLTFCQGNFAAMGSDVAAEIRYFGERGKIHFAHFRDVRGTVPTFEETFHDEGDTDMAETMQAYRDVAFDGPIRPDHAPTMAGEDNDHPGYMVMGKLYAVGYMKGLLDAIQTRKSS